MSISILRAEESDHLKEQNQFPVVSNRLTDEITLTGFPE